MNTQSIMCWQCHKKIDEQGNVEYLNNGYKHKTSIHNDRLYEFTCPEGHINYAVQTGNKFEILYELGIDALNDGYFREASTNFAVAMERFHEYCIILLMEPNTIEEYRKTISDVKLIEKYSERQYGAFYILFTKQLKIPPPIMDEKFLKASNLKLSVNSPVHFRNNITHQGYIPTKEEALSYGELSALYINQISKSIYNWRPDILKKVDSFYLESNIEDFIKLKKIKSRVMRMFQKSYVGTRNIYEGNKFPQTFDEHVQLMKFVKEINQKY